MKKLITCFILLIAPISSLSAEDREITITPPKFDDTTNLIRGAKKNYKITIREYTNFFCGYCKRVQLPMEQIIAKYPERVRHIFKYMPNSRLALSVMAAKAHIAAVKQNKGDEMRKLIFSKRFRTEDELFTLAQQLRINMVTFRIDYNSEDTKMKIKKDRQEARTLQFRGTPSFLVNNERIVGAKSFQFWDKLIQEHIKIEKPANTIIITKRKSSRQKGPIKVPEFDDTGNLIRGAKKNYKITIREYNSFFCGYCKRVQLPMEQIIAKYPKQVRHIFKYMPPYSHNLSVMAAKAHIAAVKQKKGDEMRKQIFNTRFRTEDELFKLAQQLRMDMVTFKNDYNSEDTMMKIKKDSQEGRILQFRGTPSFMINNERIIGAKSFQFWDKLIQKHIKDTD